MTARDRLNAFAALSNMRTIALSLEGKVQLLLDQMDKVTAVLSDEKVPQVIPWDSYGEIQGLGPRLDAATAIVCECLKNLIAKEAE